MTDTKPATDERIKQLENWLSKGDVEHMVGVKRSTVLSLIARIRAERENTIRECAELARNMPSIRDISPDHVQATSPIDVSAAILALSKGDQS